MLFERYIGKMSSERFAYACTLIELVKRGYRRVDAKKMIAKSDLMARLRFDNAFFFHYEEDQWADWVIEDCKYSGDYIAPCRAA